MVAGPWFRSSTIIVQSLRLCALHLSFNLPTLDSSPEWLDEIGSFVSAQFLSYTENDDGVAS